MQSRELAVKGAFEFRPKVFSDSRGIFVSPCEESAFTRATGRRFFPIGQTSHSRSKRGTLRGVHFTRTPPGGAKYVYCVNGRALDVMVDLRAGSPTFGQWEAIELDASEPRAIYFPVGVGHAFLALEDHTVICYLMSQEYDAANELAVSVLGPALGLPIPLDTDLVLSDRDTKAPMLAEAERLGLLPDYDACLKLDEAL